MNGLTLALIGAITATLLSGIGSAIGVGITARAASGVLSEKPGLFGKLLVLVALPTTNGIYGFLISILILVQTGVIGGAVVDVSMNEGWKYLFVSLPVGIVGIFAGISQAKAAASAIYMTGKKPELSARGIVMASLIETYLILALLVSVLIIFS